MKLQELIEKHRGGEIGKRTFWQLARERMLPLLEIQEIIQGGGYTY